jgi:DNA-binding CsgD family transcriptional regulator
MRGHVSSEPSVANHTHPDLTQRENDVMGWIVMGKSNGEIAEILGLGRRTVEKHCEHIFDKLGVDNRTAAVVSCMDQENGG